MKINDVIRLNEKISDDDKARIRKAASKDGKVNVKPLVQLAKNKQKTDEGWKDAVKDFFKGTDAERRQERRDKDAYDAMRLDKLTAKYEKQGLAPGKARLMAFRDVYGSPTNEAIEYDGGPIELWEGPLNAIGNMAAGVGSALKGQGYDAGVVTRQNDKTLKPLIAQIYAQWVNIWKSSPKLQSKDTPPEEKDKVFQDWANKRKGSSPDDDWNTLIAASTGSGANPKVAQANITKLMTLAFAHAQMNPDGDKQGGEQPAQQVQKGEDPPGMQHTTNTQPTKVAKHTIFSMKAAGGGEAMFRWEGGMWSQLTSNGKWQTGIPGNTNERVFKLYLDAVKQGNALAPIPGDPDLGAAFIDPTTGKRVDPDAPATKAPPGTQATGQAQAGAQAGQAQAGDTAAQVDANKDGKDDNTGEPMKPTDDAQAQGDAQQAGAVDPTRFEGAKKSISTANKAAVDELAQLLQIKKAA